MDYCKDHSKCTGEITRNTQDIAKNTDDIVDLKLVAERLTTILERIEKEKEREKEKEIPQNEKMNFWNTKAGEKTPLFIFLGVFIIVASLIGTNILEVLKVIPK